MKPLLEDTKFVPHPALVDLKSDAQRALLNYWDDLCGGELSVPVGEPDPMAMPIEYLPRIGLLEVQQAPLQFFIRLWGTAIEEGGIAEFTGKDLVEFRSAEAATKRGLWCIENKAPYIFSGPLEWPHDQYTHYSVLALPFAGDAGEVTRMVLVFEFNS